MKIHAKIRTEKNSPEKNSQELGTGIPELAPTFEQNPEQSEIARGHPFTDTFITPTQKR